MTVADQRLPAVVFGKESRLGCAGTMTAMVMRTYSIVVRARSIRKARVAPGVLTQAVKNLDNATRWSVRFPQVNGDRVAVPRAQGVRVMHRRVHTAAMARSEEKHHILTSRPATRRHLLTGNRQGE